MVFLISGQIQPPDCIFKKRNTSWPMIPHKLKGQAFSSKDTLWVALEKSLPLHHCCPGEGIV